MLPTFIADLALELRLSIFGLLPAHDIANAARASKALHTALEPILYSRIALDWRWQHDPPIALLLRTLLARPELADYVQHLHLKGTSFDWNALVVWRPEIPTINVDSLPRKEAAAAIDRMAVARSAGDEWKDKLGQGNADALVALLVCLLPNLASLHLGSLFVIENTIFGQVLRQSLCDKGNTGGTQKTLPTFRKLRQVVFPKERQDAHRRDQCKNASDVLPLFYLPALESLTLFIDNPVEFAWPAGVAAPIASALTSLQLFRLREQLLGRILCATPHLKHLTWQCFYQNGLDRPMSQDTMDLDAIGAALAPVRESLVELVLDALTEIGPRDIDHPFINTSGSLSGLLDMRSVKTLSVPWVFLMGFSPLEQRSLLGLLPGSLERLIVTRRLAKHDAWKWEGPLEGYDEEDDEDLRIVTATIIAALQELDRARLPNLCSIVVAWKPQPEERSPEQLKELENIHRNHGVRVEWKW